MRPHPRRARTNATAPEAWATSDRNGMINNQRDLLWQYDWAGTQLINKRILVSRDEYDEPQRQLGTIILPPDPVSIPNARPEPYAIDEYWMFEFEGVNASILEMEGSEAALTLEYGIYDNDGNYPAAGPFPISGFPVPSPTAPVFDFSKVKESQYLVVILGGWA
jgi:hypothetical protein